MARRFRYPGRAGPQARSHPRIPSTRDPVFPRQAPPGVRATGPVPARQEAGIHVPVMGPRFQRRVGAGTARREGVAGPAPAPGVLRLDPGARGRRRALGVRDGRLPRPGAGPDDRGPGGDRPPLPGHREPGPPPLRHGGGGAGRLRPRGRLHGRGAHDPGSRQHHPDLDRRPPPPPRGDPPRDGRPAQAPEAGLASRHVPGLPAGRGDDPVRLPGRTVPPPLRSGPGRHDAPGRSRPSPAGTGWGPWSSPRASSAPCG